MAGDKIEQIVHKLQRQDPESTSFPYWIIIDPTQNMSKDPHEAASQITGVFFARADAEAFLAETRYNFSKHAVVYCCSGTYSPDWVNLFK